MHNHFLSFLSISRRKEFDMAPEVTYPHLLILQQASLRVFLTFIVIIDRLEASFTSSPVLNSGEKVKSSKFVDFFHFSFRRTCIFQQFKYHGLTSSADNNLLERVSDQRALQKIHIWLILFANELFRRSCYLDY